MANVYNPGDLVTITCTFKDSGGSNTDPTTITGRFQGSDQATPTEYVYGTDVELVKSATGIYYFQIDTTALAGQEVSHVMIGTGAVAEVAQDTFFVLPLLVAAASA